MKHLLTLAALLVSTLSLAQFTPYNPDADNDQFVGAQDLLAFLPLFGEDWNLDSLNIYATSELDPPSWCVNPANPAYSCDYYRVVPQDADIIYNDAQNGEGYELIMPETPKPLIIFGTLAWSEAYPGSFYDLDMNNLNPKVFGPVVQSDSNPYFSLLTGFLGNWFHLH